MRTNEEMVVQILDFVESGTESNEEQKKDILRVLDNLGTKDIYIDQESTMNVGQHIRKKLITGVGEEKPVMLTEEEFEKKFEREFTRKHKRIAYFFKKIKEILNRRG